MNENIYDEYQANRFNHTVPARLAWHWTRQRLELLDRMARLQFAWAIRDGQCRQARWKQDGFEVRAMVIADPDGWFDIGIFMYGKFTHHWQAGAVRHWQGNERTYPWFIPADPSSRHEYYRRACDFGDGWSYVGVKLIVSKQGVTLATETRLGIESDADVEVFTEAALELADIAVPEAQAKMKELCGCGKAA